MKNLHKSNLYPAMRAIIQELTIQNVLCAPFARAAIKELLWGA